MRQLMPRPKVYREARGLSGRGMSTVNWSQIGAAVGMVMWRVPASIVAQLLDGRPLVVTRERKSRPGTVAHGL
jgi:hypothetical protein